MSGTDRPPIPTMVLRLARRAVTYELGMWRSLYRWVFRRPASRDPGAVAFGYSGMVTSLLIVFIVVSAIEIPVIHLVVPWEGLRLALDALGVYGLLWMFGLLASLRVYPHIVADPGLRVRNGFSLDVTIAWDDIDTIRSRGRDLPGPTVQVDHAEAGTVLKIGMMRQTNIDVTLRRPVSVPVAKTNGEPVSELRFYADDANALIAAARRHLAARLPGNDAGQPVS